MIKLFFSYSHKDEGLRDQLAVHLSAMKRQGVIDDWHDRSMLAGDHIDATIKAAMERADIVLLLVSPDFIASDYCYDVEMTQAVQRHIEGRCRTIPVILRPCDWHGTPFGKLLATPRDGKAVTLWRNLDEAFVDVARSIRAAAEDMRRRKGGGAPAGDVQPPVRAAPAASTPEAAPSPATPPGRRLRLAGPATDAEKDDFMEAAFDTVLRRFRDELAALEGTHPGVRGSFRQIDADHFIATVYVNGDAKCRCKIWHGRGGMMRGINYSQNQSSDDSSLNENLSLEQAEGELRLKAMGWAMHGNSRERTMDPEQAGAFYWSLFIQPLR